MNVFHSAGTVATGIAISIAGCRAATETPELEKAEIFPPVARVVEDPLQTTPPAFPQKTTGEESTEARGKDTPLESATAANSSELPAAEFDKESFDAALATSSMPEVSLQEALDKHGHPLAKSPAITWSEWSDYTDRVFTSAGMVDSPDESGGVVADSWDFRAELKERFNLDNMKGLANTWLHEKGAAPGEIATQDAHAYTRFSNDMIQWFREEYGDTPVPKEHAIEAGQKFAVEHATSYLPETLKDQHVSMLGFEVMDILRGHIEIVASAPETDEIPLDPLFKGIRLPRR